MTLSDHIEAYCRERELNRTTEIDYWHMARIFTEWSKHVPLETLSVDDATTLVNDWIISLRERTSATTNEKLSAWTIRGYRAKVLVIWRHARNTGKLPTMPETFRVRKVKTTQLRCEGWRSDDLAKLIEYCEIEPSMRRRLRTVKVAKGLYLGALFRFLRNCGMRLGDALQVRFTDISSGTITWQQHKTGIWHRAELWPSTLRAIERIREPARDFIWFQGTTQRRGLYRMIQLAVKRAGMSGTTKYIRRGVATDVFCAGADPSAALGHVPGSRVAFKHYVDPLVTIRTVPLREDEALQSRGAG